MSVDRSSKLTGILIGGAMGMVLSAYGASAVVASGLRFVFL